MIQLTKMNSEEELLGLLVAWDNLPLMISDLKTEPEKIDLLMNIALHSRHPRSWRAAWMADKINDDSPELIAPYIGKMITSLGNETSSSKKRHFIKLISLHQIPAACHSLLMDYCLNCFMSGDEPVAVRVHALQVLYNISEAEPDFKPELLAVIEHEMNLHATAGIRSRGTHLARKLAAEMKGRHI